ncbi:geranylgeranylglyceryl/heptaprenylglyceryl phosphate synthase [Effusibacillus pohliae]|uniref:heptaprenylglyceryl phosphate synthase n=1 Tax=Effusibacillus pohliae TaxID=232270 RepID=UPI00036ACE2C|nr:heptaprenylglyceryl phosphate synthase [Effusibacillus pohliae]
MSGQPHPWRNWRHVVKLDPDRPIGNSDLRELGRIGTDAVLIGGTQGITFEKSADLLRRLRVQAPNLPVWQEISSQSSILPDADGYGIPVVLNAGATEWLIGRHTSAIERYGPLIPWERVVPEGYIVLNPHAAVARLTGALVPESPQQLAAYAVAAERIFGMQTLYLEYSGAYGDPQWVGQVRQATSLHLVYGGGVHSAERAAEMAALVDTVVVGNVLYEKGIEAVRETVRAVREIRG